MEFRSVQGMERLRPQQDGMIVLLVVVIGMKGGFSNNLIDGYVLEMQFVVLCCEYD
jgi:hypothetical protein